MSKDIDRVLDLIQQGVTSQDQANDLLVQCYNVITDLISTTPPKSKPGRWGMARLWRSWMGVTSEFMAGNGAIMPLWVNKDGTYTKTRAFNAEDAHELFTIKHLGTDHNGKRLSWKKAPENGEVIADQGQRFHALQQHQIWMVERGIKHINPREGEFASLCAMADGQ